MAKKELEDVVVYVTPGEPQQIWLGRAKGTVRGDVDMLTDLAEETKPVRFLVPGDSQHAGLILRLCETRPVLVGSPAIYRGNDRDDGCNIVKLLKRLSLRSPLFGGWRPVTEHDVPVFSFLESYYRTGLSQETRTLFAQHPGGRAAQLGGGNEDAMIRVLAFMEDPRWFTDEDDPDSEAKLRSYFGLNSENAKYLLKQRDKGGFQQLNATVLFEATGMWLHADKHSGGAKLLLSDETESILLAQPFAYLFLRRCAIFDRAHGCLLFALETYLSLIRQVWLYNCQPLRPELFAPEHFATVFGDENIQKVILPRLQVLLDMRSSRKP